MEQRRTRTWLRPVVVGVVQVVVVAVLCWAIFRTIDTARLVDVLRKVDLPLFALAIVPLVLERLVRPIRLSVLFGRAVPIRDAIAAQSVSQLVNLVLPMRSGEISLVVMLRGLGHTSVPYALSIVLIDRLMDVAIVLLLFIWALIAVPGLPVAADTGAAILAVGTVGAIAAMVIAFRHKAGLLSAVSGMIARIAGNRAAGWLSRIEAIVDGFAVLSDPHKLVMASIATVVTWALAALASWMMLIAIWPDGPFAAVVLAMCFATIGTILISVPAGVGVVHAATTVAIVMFGASQEVGLAYAVLAHFTVTSVTATMGLAFLPVIRRMNLSIWKSKQSPATDTQ